MWSSSPQRKPVGGRTRSADDGIGRTRLQSSGREVGTSLHRPDFRLDFYGRVQRWNDPALAALNPNFTLPDREIAVVHRLDSSGTTYVWTDYLAKVSPEWQKTLGVAKSVDWPTGIAAKGNEGVAGQVKQIPWSLGYAKLTYGIADVLSVGAVQNADGDFIEPQPASVTAAPTIP
jgi:phosphate transport system substrate-binding protein